MKRLWPLCAVALFLAACSSSTPQTHPTPAPTKLADKTAEDILDAATAAMTAKGSVHIVTTASGGKNRLIQIVNDTGPDSGRQVITGAGMRVEIRLVASIAYLRANQVGLANFIGFPLSQARLLADKWLTFTSGENGYNDLVESLDMPSLIADVRLTGALTKTAVTTIEGRAVIGIKGKGRLGGADMLHVATEGDPLPVEETNTDKGEVDTSLFSRWGETVKVTAPAGAISGPGVVA